MSRPRSLPAQTITMREKVHEHCMLHYPIIVAWSQSRLPALGPPRSDASVPCRCEATRPTGPAVSGSGRPFRGVQTSNRASSLIPLFLHTPPHLQPISQPQRHPHVRSCDLPTPAPSTTNSLASRCSSPVISAPFTPHAGCFSPGGSQGGPERGHQMCRLLCSEPLSDCDGPPQGLAPLRV